MGYGPFYAVVRVNDGAVMYSGKSDYKTAVALVPGTHYAVAETEQGAIDLAKQQSTHHRQAA